MTNQAQNMYALPLDKCVELIKAIGKKRTVLAQGDMGNGKSSMLTTLAKDLPCLLYTSPSPRDRTRSRMPSSA